MPTYKLNCIKKIQVKSSRNASNKMDKICPEKQQQQNAFIVKISAHSELQNRNEKSYRTQIRARIKSPNAKSKFFKPK